MTSRRLECFRSLTRSWLTFTASLGLVAFGSTAPLGAQPDDEEAASARASEDTGWVDAGDDYPISGSPAAQRNLPDRPLRLKWSSFPPTLRVDGPDSRLVQTRILHSLIYEGLVDIHKDTEELIPRLAREWRIQTDFENERQTFWFRIDEKARFSDGSAVDAEDVYYSWRHKVEPDRNDPSNEMVFDDFEEPVIVDEHTIKVTTKKLNWRLFFYFSGIEIYPTESITVPKEEGELLEGEMLDLLPGAEYIERYNWTFIPGSGPYELREGDVKEGQSLTLTRRDDWWARNERWAKHSYNFGKLKWTVVLEQELHYQKFLLGEFDHFGLVRSQRWVEEVPGEDAVVMGWVQRRKIYNDAPRGYSGMAMNMRVPPFDDIRVRKAVAHLFNRKKLNRELFFDEYEMLDSYIPGRDWGNGANNEKIEFDRDKAEELLWEAGYRERDDDGYLVGPDGERFELTFVYGWPAWERIWLVVKKDFEDAGIKFDLRLIDYAQVIKKVGERQFKIHYQGWSALRFPNPQTAFSSELAAKKQNNNITGFESAEVDALLEEYDHTFDLKRQKEITRKIDELIYQEHPYALGWYSTFERILYWNRFGHPKTYWTRIGDNLDEQILTYWWWDLEKIDELDRAMKEGKKLSQGIVFQKPWAQWKKK